MNDNVIYIPTCISPTKHTQFHKWNTDVVKFTILLKEDEFNGRVIDFCYFVKDLELVGASYLDECLVWHFRFHRILPLPSLFRNSEISNLIGSDFDWNDYLAIRDIYYPKNMKLPWYCNLIKKNKRRKRSED